jgi:hypothetical protein
VVVDHEQVHKQFLFHQLVHLPYIYMLVQLHWMNYIQYEQNHDEDVDVYDVMANQFL